MKEIQLKVEVEVEGVRLEKVKCYKARNMSRIMEMIGDDFDYESIIIYTENGLRQVGFYCDGKSLAIGKIVGEFNDSDNGVTVLRNTQYKTVDLDLTQVPKCGNRYCGRIVSVSIAQANDGCCCIECEYKFHSQVRDEQAREKESITKEGGI